MAILLVYINQLSIHFLINGFSSVSASNLKVYFLDVGQASSTLIILPNKATVLIDAGSGESENQLVKNLNFLLAENSLSEIDYMIFTHPDEDHVGGAVGVLKSFQVYNVFRPKVVSTSKLEVENVNDFKVVETDVYANVTTAVFEEPNCNVNFVDDFVLLAGNDASLRFWSCHEDIYPETNAYSPFITLNYLDFTFLFCGDATEQREKEFVKDLKESGYNNKIDFLSVAHHGSKFSTTDLFLDAIEPSYAFVSAKDLIYPSSEVVTRLKNHNIKEIFTTRDVGTIGVGISENGKFYIKMMTNYIDLPFLIFVVCLVSFVFMIAKPYEVWKKHKKYRFSSWN